MRPTVRVRLTALYGGLFVACAVLLLGASAWLVDGHLARTLPPAVAADARGELLTQYAIALAGATLVAVAIGWAMAGRVLAPLARMTAAVRRISQDQLGERIALGGPRDELRELADTLDAMLGRLDEAFVAERRFVANASHELRSPLTVIRTEAEVALADPDAGPQELREMGAAVVAATERTDALLESLLLLAHSQRGVPQPERVAVADVVRTAAGSVSREAADLAIDLRVAPGASEPVVVGDRRLLERLVANLLENGVRYNAPGGFVALDVLADGAGPVIRVANSGPEVSADAVQRLAEPFERGGRRGHGRGAGLGLSIVRSVAEAHGGALRLAARPGGGLLAEVGLPAADQMRRRPSRSSHSPSRLQPS